MSVSEIKSAIGIDDRNLIKEWSSEFREHLTPEANPPKGVTRSFSPIDLPVFAYVSMRWEEDPDLENIHIGLQLGEHRQGKFDDLLSPNRPLFEEISDEPSGNGVLIGGLADLYDPFVLADSYKLAGDALVDTILTGNEECELVRPVLYNYRHAVELYFKAVLPPSRERSHALRPLLDQLRTKIKREHSQTVPAWFEQTVLALHDFDPYSTAFRYLCDGQARDEVSIDLHHWKGRMTALANAFQIVRRAATARTAPRAT